MAVGIRMRFALGCAVLCATTTAGRASPPDAQATGIDGRALRVSTSEVEVSRTDLVEVLKNRGMTVNGDVAALVYELNPELVLPLRAGTLVRLPLLLHDDGRPCGSECQGSVVAFPSAKKQLLEDLTRLEQLVPILAQLPAERFEDPNQTLRMQERAPLYV